MYKTLQKNAILPILGMALLGGWATQDTAHAQPKAPKLTMAVTAKGIKSGTGAIKPIGVTNTFKPSDRKLYALYNLSKPIAGYGRSVWIAVKADTIKPNTILHESKTPSYPNFQYGEFSLSNSIDWPRGQYKVALYVNKTFLKTLFFSVK